MPSSETENEPTKSSEASMGGESASEAPTEAQKNNSVFDFLYHDTRRVGSFLAQFHDHGLLSQTKAKEAVKRSTTTKTGLSGKLDLPIIGHGGGNLDRATTDDEADEAEYTYDPLWKNARTLLNYLAEWDMVQRDIWQAKIGQFVLVKGALIILDLEMFKEIYKDPKIVELIKSGIPE